MNILQINSSIFAGGGQSTRLADGFVALLAQGQATRVTVRELALEPLPHLDGERFAAFLAQPAERSAVQQTAVDLSDRLIDELRAADVIVIGVPMYNFGIPSQLKAWFDHVARAGVTFRYTENGSEGLLKGKKTYVFSTRGGQYAGTERDSETAHVSAFLALLGLTDVTFVYAEGLALGEATRQARLTDAQATIERLAVARHGDLPFDHRHAHAISHSSHP
jgi:FMN-dependent NADH-azoreductase